MSGSSSADLAKELAVYRSMLEQHRRQLEVTENALADEREANHELRHELESLRNSEHGTGMFSWSWGGQGDGSEGRTVQRLQARVSELEADLARQRVVVTQARRSSIAATAGVGGSADAELLAGQVASLKRKLALEEERHEATLQLLAQARDPVYVAGTLDGSDTAARLVTESETKMKFFRLAQERDALAKDDDALHAKTTAHLQSKIDSLTRELDADVGRAALVKALEDARRKLLETVISRDALRSTDTDGMEEHLQERVSQILDDALRMHINIPELRGPAPQSAHGESSATRSAPGRESAAAPAVDSAKLVAANTKIDALERELDQREEDLAAARDDIERLDNEVEHLESLNASLRSKLSDARAAAAAAEASVSAMHSTSVTVDSSLLETETDLLDKLHRAQDKITHALNREAQASPTRRRRRKHR